MTKESLGRIGIAILVAAAAASAALALANTNRVAWGVSAGGVPVAGYTREAANRALEAAAAIFLREPISVSLAGRTITATPEALGVRIDSTATAEAAWRFGRDPNPVRAAAAQVKAAVAGARLRAIATVDEATLGQFLAEQFGDAETPVREPILAWRDRTLVVMQGAPGRLIDRRRAAANLRESAERFAAVTLVLERIYAAPNIADRTAEAARENAEAVLAGTPYALTAGSKTITVDRNLLRAWLTFPDLTVDVDRDAIAEVLAELAPTVNRPAINAVLDERNDDVVEAQPNQAGARLLVAENVERIRQHVLTGGRQPLLLEFAPVPATVSLERLRAIGATARLASAETDFSGSSPSRIHNIKVAAAKFNGLLIDPGATFSFNDAIGPIDASTGYEFALVIKNGKTIPEYGGGVCQVSTTLFQAAAKAGLDITKRFPHAYPVRYYGAVPGFDATIYPGGPDLVFRNDTGSPVLVQMRVVKTKLAVDLFGAPDGRAVMIDGPREFDRKPDGSVKARLTQTVKRSGEIVRAKTFWSNYKSPDLYPVERNPLE